VSFDNQIRTPSSSNPSPKVKFKLWHKTKPYPWSNQLTSSKLTCQSIKNCITLSSSQKRNTGSKCQLWTPFHRLKNCRNLARSKLITYSRLSNIKNQWTPSPNVRTLTWEFKKLSIFLLSIRSKSGINSWWETIMLGCRHNYHRKGWFNKKDQNRGRSLSKSRNL
jgi:hypothetical protein